MAWTQCTTGTEIDDHETICGIVRQIRIFGGLFALVNALVLFGKNRRCLHDYIAGARVIAA